MTDIIICQMGKVASTAIYQAIQAAGKDAIHTHFLGEVALLGVVKTITNPDAHPKVVEHGTEQLLKGIEITRLTHRYRMRKTGEKLKVITLARDPIARYRALFVQNFEKFIGGVRAWDQSGDHLASLFQAVFDAAEQVEDVEAVIRGCPEIVYSHLNMLFAPLQWFDTNIKTPLGVDIYSKALNEHGYQIYETDYCEVLLIKFERLKDLWPAIGNFVQIDCLTVPKRNVSSDKPYYTEVIDAFSQLKTGPCKPLYNSRYCRFFGYS